MQRAKYNLENEYSVVGIHEEIEKTLKVLEAYVPLFFRNAIEVSNSKAGIVCRLHFKMLFRYLTTRARRTTRKSFM